jgi:hypothetical protein
MRRRGFRFWRKADTAFAFSRLFRVQLSRFGEAFFDRYHALPTPSFCYDASVPIGLPTFKQLQRA